MSDHEKDWLDDRLADQGYLPDAGFTARVTDRLPKTRQANAFRVQILLVATVFCLALAAVLIGPLITTIGEMAGPYFQADNIGYLLAQLRQPKFLYAAEVLSIVATLGAIPLLRRWV